jgi:hypothetical protein
MHEFCPPVSELVQALVQLMQQASLSKHRSGDDFGMINQGIDRHEKIFTLFLSFLPKLQEFLFTWFLDKCLLH